MCPCVCAVHYDCGRGLARLDNNSAQSLALSCSFLAGFDQKNSPPRSSSAECRRVERRRPAQLQERQRRQGRGARPQAKPLIISSRSRAHRFWVACLTCCAGSLETSAAPLQSQAADDTTLEHLGRRRGRHHNRTCKCNPVRLIHHTHPSLRFCATKSWGQLLHFIIQHSAPGQAAVCHCLVEKAAGKREGVWGGADTQVIFTLNLDAPLQHAGHYSGFLMVMRVLSLIALAVQLIIHSVQHLHRAPGTYNKVKEPFCQTPSSSRDHCTEAAA